MNRQPTELRPDEQEAVDAVNERQWFCCCMNPGCKGEGPWWTPDGDREFFVTAEQEPRCPECGDTEKVWVYPY